MVSKAKVCCFNFGQSNKDAMRKKKYWLSLSNPIAKPHNGLVKVSESNHVCSLITDTNL